MFYQLVNSSHDLHSLAIYAVAIIVAFVIGIGFHEFSHVAIAYLLGDTTGRDMGRLTLNPIRHLDPFGSMMLLLVGFGWGKPAPVNPYKLRTGPETGWALVALAGPGSNFLMAAVLAALLKLGPLQQSLLSGLPGAAIQGVTAPGFGWTDFFVAVILVTVLINILLGVFNLIPIPPLDGYRVLLRLLPSDLAASYRRIEQYGPVIILLLFTIPFFTGSRINPLGDLITPVSNGVQRVLLGG
jgi:Zn-dependent protease